MVDLQKENGEGKVGTEKVSVSEEKRHYLLDKLSGLMDQAGGDYSPFLIEELLQRLEFVVKNFNEELITLINSSFKEWKIKDSQLRDLMAQNLGNLQAPKNHIVKEKLDDFSKPNFIKDVHFGPTRIK